MPTASIYYRPTDRTLPQYVLIGGRQADVTDADIRAASGQGYNRAAVDAACRRLGYQAAPGALIVRQDDVRGTIRIEPVPTPPPGPGTLRLTLTVDIDPADLFNAYDPDVTDDPNIAAALARGDLKPGHGVELLFSPTGDVARGTIVTVAAAPAAGGV